MKVGELVRRLGVEHCTVNLDWGSGGTPRKGKVQILAREKRYTALLKICKEMNIGTLLVGHHQDDQNGMLHFVPVYNNVYCCSQTTFSLTSSVSWCLDAMLMYVFSTTETFIMRLAMGSGLEGLGSMYPVSYWPGYPATQIVRPLLEWRKSDVVEVCRSEGVEWVEDPSNMSCDYMRNIIRAKLADHPDVRSGLPQLISSCSNTRNIIHKRGVSLSACYSISLCHFLSFSK